MVSEDGPQLDLLPGSQIVELLLDAEQRVVPAVRAAANRVAEAAELVAARLATGGRLVLTGAGSSGRIAFAEAAELPGTFGLPPWSVVACLAGGLDGTDWDEDDARSAERDMARVGPQAGDALVAVAASGSTPYTLSIASSFRDRGAAVVAVANTAGSPLARLADIAIEVPIGPEVLRGSTRLSAGTAQKIVLNALTTTAMSRLGRVHGNVMIDVIAANAKLRDRVAGMVAQVAGCTLDAARDALRECDGNARAAIVHLVCGVDPDAAREQATRHATLRAALSASSARAGAVRHDARMNSSDVTSRLAALRASTADLLAGLDAEAWMDADVRAASALPGWTRAHVLTHIARNADGISDTIEGALRGKKVARYPGGREGRSADIEAGAHRTAADLIADVRDSAARLDGIFDAVADAGGWELPTEERPVRAWITGRWREVEVHRVDLGGAYTARDWPAAFVEYLLPRMAAQAGSRLGRAARIEVVADGSTTGSLVGSVWTAGEGAAVTVAGPDWALLAWLTGRPSLAAGTLSSVPELAPWL